MDYYISYDISAVTIESVQARNIKMRVIDDTLVGVPGAMRNSFERYMIWDSTL